MTDKASKQPEHQNDVSENFESLQQGLIGLLERISEEILSDEEKALITTFRNFSLKNYIKLAADSSLAAENTPDAIAKLQFLSKELELKDKKMQDFKISLADAIIETRSLESEKKKLLDQSQEQQAEISQMQLHTKELSLRLDSAENKLQEMRENLRLLTAEKLRLSTRNNELSEIRDTLEREVSTLKSNLDKVLESDAKNLKLALKAEKENKDLKEYSERLKIRISEIENSESELIDAIDALQKEKANLQTRLDKFLSNFKKEFVYENRDRSSAPRSSVLEPSFFSEYLPFCFPERIPTIRKLKAGRPFVLSSVGKTPSIKPTKVMHSLELKIPRKAVLRVITLASEMKSEKIAEFEHKLVQEASFVAKMKLDSESSFEPGYTEKTPNFFHRQDHLKKHIFQTKMKLRFFSSRPEKRLNFSSLPEFGIRTYSIDLFLAYLSNSIFSKHYNKINPSDETYSVIKKKPEIKKKLETKNLITEKLAFRHKYQLKFQKIILERKGLVHGFNKDDKLKAVLETFGNTISSMVRKYDVFSPFSKQKKTT